MIGPAIAVGCWNGNVDSSTSSGPVALETSPPVLTPAW
jgi:hypothetical protein